MHILGILVFLLALIVAGEVIRSTLAANAEKIVAALAGTAALPATRLVLVDHVEPSRVHELRRRPISPPLLLPLAA